MNGQNTSIWYLLLINLIALLTKCIEWQLVRLWRVGSIFNFHAKVLCISCTIFKLRRSWLYDIRSSPAQLSSKKGSFLLVATSTVEACSLSCPSLPSLKEFKCFWSPACITSHRLALSSRMPNSFAQTFSLTAPHSATAYIWSELSKSDCCWMFCRLLLLY